MDPKRLKSSSGRRVSSERRPSVVVNSVKMLQRREICAKFNKDFSLSNAQEKFRNMHLVEEYDIHGPCIHCGMALPILMPKTEVIEIVAAQDIVFALTKSGLCAVFSKVTNERICFMNVSHDEVIRSLFYNKSNDSLITISVCHATSPGYLKCRSTTMEWIRRGEPDVGFSIFESDSESCKWPTFVEIDDQNGIVLTYTAQDNIYTVFELKSYTTLYSISDKYLYDIKVSLGTMLLVYKRARNHLPMKILSIEDGTVLRSFNFPLHCEKKIHFIEQLNEKLFVKPENENLQILDVNNFELTEVSMNEFITPSACEVLHKHDLLLLYANHCVAIWNFRGELVNSYKDYLQLTTNYKNNYVRFLTSAQDLCISYCKANAESQRPDGGSGGFIHIYNIITGKCLGKIDEHYGSPNVEEFKGTVGANPRKRIRANQMRSKVADALEDVTCIFYDEESNEIYTGNRLGLVHFWSN